MKKFVTASAMLVIALLVAPSSFADEHTQTLNYVAPGGVTPGASLYVATSTLAPELGGDVGGARFPAQDLAASWVDIADASGRAVGYTVAQDFNADGLSGQAGEPRVAGCGTSASLATSTVAFRADLPVVVFIVEAPTCAQAAVATSGSITLTYA